MQNKVRILTILLLIIPTAILLCACSDVKSNVATSTTVSATVFVTTSVTPTAEHTTVSLDNPPSTMPQEEDFILASAGICYDLTGGRILYEKNTSDKVYPASMTKLMTALLMSEYGKNHTFVTGDEIYLIDPQSSIAFLVEGIEMNLYQALAALMIPSGNDAAYMAAVNIARLRGGEMDNETALSYFVDMMNDKAAALGMTNTHFTCPDGIHNDDHYTTADDFLKLAIAVSHNQDILSVSGISHLSLYAESGEYFEWDNGNPLYSDEYDIVGLKSGYTDEAGRCFCALNVDSQTGRETIAVVFGEEDTATRDNDIIRLIELNK